jgi:hypothetical protein
MDRPKQFTIISRNLKTPMEDLAQAVRRAGEMIPELVVDNEDPMGGVITVTLTEERAKEMAHLLGEDFVISLNSRLNLIK